MDKPFVNAPAPDSGQLESLSWDRILAVVWASAVDAFIKSLMVLVVGSVAIGLAGSLWQEMTPTAPPGFTGKAENGTNFSTAGHSWGAWVNHHRFVIVFGLIFVPSLWVRLVRRDGRGEQSKATSRLERIARRLSEQWFGLIVGNALGAIISAFVLVWVQQFTITRMLFGWLLDSVLAGIQNVVQALLGATRGDGLRAWLGWYGENRFKFAFWLFYLAAISDDLGIPNFKTLGRWLGRQVRNRRKQRRSSPSKSTMD